jgi:hypothetical protein
MCSPKKHEIMEDLMVFQNYASHAMLLAERMLIWASVFQYVPIRHCLHTLN